jgi:hypothetical protein
MIIQANKTFGDGGGWERPWTLLLARAMIIFFGCMFMVGTFVLIFGNA